MSMKKKGLGTFILKGVLAAAGYAALIVGGMWLRYRHAMEKMKNHLDERNQMNSILFGKQTVYYGQDTKNGYFTCLSGAMTIVLKEQPTSNVINLDLVSVFGKVTLILPPEVRIEYSGSGCLESVRDCRGEELGAVPCTIQLTRKSFASQLVIKSGS